MIVQFDENGNPIHDLDIGEYVIKMSLIADGKKMGLEEGTQAARKNIITKMLEHDINKNEISKLLKMSLKKVEEILNLKLWFNPDVDIPVPFSDYEYFKKLEILQYNARVETINKGRKPSRTKGYAIEQKRIINNMYNKGMSIEEISGTTEIPINKIKKALNT